MSLQIGAFARVYCLETILVINRGLEQIEQIVEQTLHRWPALLIHAGVFIHIYWQYLIRPSLLVLASYYCRYHFK